MGMPVPNYHKCSAVVELSMERGFTFQGFYACTLTSKDQGTTA